MPGTRVAPSESRAEHATGLASHLVETPDPSWAFWRTIFLRGAGFDARLPEQLADEACASAGDQVLACERAVMDARQSAMAALREALERAEGEAVRKPLAHALRRLRKWRIPDDDRLIPEPARLELLTAWSLRDELRDRYSRAFNRCAAETTERINALADDPRFREAVLLQNARAFGRARQVLSHSSPARRGFRERQAQALIASYLQRYCLKNDTIGFFGPVGWASFDPAGRGISLHPGAALVARTSVHFEHWVVDALAEKIGQDPAYRPWLKPRLLPLFHVEADSAHLLTPGGGRFPLVPLDAEILRRCDGTRTARRIALDMLDLAVDGAASEDDVYEALRRLVAKRTVHWGLDIPYGSHPERSLREALLAVEPEPLLRRVMALLDELEDGREGVRLALGDPDRLSLALAALDATFERLTGQRSTREPGRMYAGRTVVYTDCERDAEVRVGRDVIEALTGPLSLVLKSARWLTHQLASRYSEAFGEMYRELAAAHGTPVDLTRFWARAQGVLLDPGARALEPVVADLRRRWEMILPVSPAQRRVRCTTEQLRAAVDDLFEAPRAGWGFARCHCPDVMIAARSADAVGRGEYFAVLGELHLATHTFRSGLTLSQHHDPERLLSAIEADMDAANVTPVPPRSWPRLTGRTSLALVPRHNYYFEASPDTVAPAPRSRVLSIASLVVDQSPDGLRVRTRDGRVSFDIIEFAGELLSLVTVDVMKGLYSGPHVPRITIDRLVINRECWTVRADALDFLDLPNEAERYLRLRAWTRAVGFPRRMFVSVPIETKPFFVDFDSPIYADILIKTLRRVRENADPPVATLTEMLPTPEQLWLRDSQQRHYTCELRIVARDLLA